jgi:hypothetical protein
VGGGVETAVDAAALTEGNMYVKSSQGELLFDDLLFTVCRFRICYLTNDSLLFMCKSTNKV